MKRIKLHFKELVVSMLVILFMMGMTVSATSSSGVQIFLPEKQAWVNSSTETRSGAYSYVTATLDSVYPPSGTDNYTHAQVQIRTTNNLVLAGNSPIVLDEGYGYNIYLPQGYLNYTYIDFYYRGNTNQPASAVVSNDAH
jgi:hypothetical protein